MTVRSWRFEGVQGLHNCVEIIHVCCLHNIVQNEWLEVCAEKNC